MSYAIVETGSKQYKVKEGDRITVEKLPQAEGDQLVLPNILFVHNDKETVFGNPYIEKAGVLCTVLDQDRGPKLMTYKIKKRKGYRRKIGHRQGLTLLKIEKISLTGVEAKAAPKKVAAKKPATRKTGVKASTKTVKSAKKGKS